VLLWGGGNHREGCIKTGTNLAKREVENIDDDASIIIQTPDNQYISVR
jgi:hypothetical protein